MKAVNLFYTPSSMEEMQDILEALPVEQRALVYPYCFMMYNLMVTIMNMNTPTEGKVIAENS